MEMAIVADDIVASNNDSLASSLHWQMTRYRSASIETYGKTAIDMTKVVSEVPEAKTLTQAEHTAKFMISSVKHAAYLAANYKELFLPLANGQSSIAVRHDGIQTHWISGGLSGIIGVSRAAFDREVADVMSPVDPSSIDYSDRYKVWSFNEPRLQPLYTGDPNVSTISRALWLAKRNRLSQELSVRANGDLSMKQGQYYYLLHTGYQEHLDLDVANKLRAAIDSYSTYKPSMYDLKAIRQDVLDDQARHFARQDNIRRELASRKFASFWDGMKSSAIIPTVSQAASEWATIPLKAAGIETSRTWGIEIETVRANETSRPSGWESRHDGSLPEGDCPDCSCDCNDCSDNSDHCADGDYSCYESGEWTASGQYSREFVSPILSHFNSQGLRELCRDLGTDPDEDSSPGIHVHVGAKDLTVADVTRLLVAYSAIERFMEPLLHRKERGYCKETTTDTLRWWLRKTKEYAHANPDDIPLARDFIHDREATPNGRYVDVNLHSLSAHGTIEFRSMGAWYDYEHLVRWAWFAREMVNVSKLGIDQREWTSCRSITDVIQLLRKYGTEMPSNDLFAKLDTDINQMFAER
jgi:hypothetical protein